MSGRRRWGLLVALVVVLGACGSNGDTSGPPAGGDAIDSPAGDSFALALGIDVVDPGSVDPLLAYDLVVVDGAQTSAAAIARLQDGGATVLGYLSAGTLEPGRPWFAAAEDQGWLLEHWDDWDEWYADVSEPGLRALLVDEARSELDKGFDGLFLDNTDMVEGHPDQRDGMRALVAALDDLTEDDLLLFAQNGDPVASGIIDHLDGWNREDVSSTYDFDAKEYVAVPEGDHREALAQLRTLHDAGLIVTATDYFGRPEGGAAAVAAEAACTAGAIPFASNIGLTRIADPPLTCADP